MPDPIQEAADRFEQGFSCSQAILTSFAPPLGLGEDFAFKIAAPFGGGIARQGDACGAVTGALMVLGLKFGPQAGESNETIYRISQEFIRRFQEQHAFIQCRQLIDFDLRLAEELAAAREAQVFKRICPRLVKTAAEILTSLLNSSMHPAQSQEQE